MRNAVPEAAESPPVPSDTDNPVPDTFVRLTLFVPPPDVTDVKVRLDPSVTPFMLIAWPVGALIELVPLTLSVPPFVAVKAVFPPVVSVSPPLRLMVEPALL